MIRREPDAAASKRFARTAHSAASVHVAGMLRMLGRVRMMGIVVACAVLCAIGMAVPVAHAQTATADVGVWQKFDADQLNGVQKTFDYRLEAITPGAPLPEGGANGIYDWQMTGSEHLTLKISADVPFQDPYEYRMYQNIGQKKAGYTYDSTVYLMRLYTVGENGDTLMAIVYDEAGMEKVPDPGWTLSYEADKAGNVTSKHTPDSPRSALAKTLDALDVTVLAVLVLVSVGVVAIARYGSLRAARKRKMGDRP